MLLSKFYSFENYHVSAFNEYSAWFSKPYAFNDPFEGNYKLDLSDISIEHFISIIFHDIDDAKLNPYHDFFKKVLIEQQVDKNTAIKILTPILYDSTMKHKEDLINQMSILVKSVQDAFKNSGVCCFFSGETNRAINNPMMWGHYGNGLRGFAISFEPVDGSIFEEQNLSSLFVNYSNTPPTFSPLEIAVRFMSTSDSALKSELVKALLEITHTKGSHWVAEREFRFSCKEGNRLVKYKKGVMKSLYIGDKMDSWQKATLISIAKNNGVENIYTASTSHETYDIILKQI